MLNTNEKKILEILEKRHLVTKSELMSILDGERMNGADVSVSRLKDRGYIEQVQNLGNCLVITKEGLKVLKKY
jgi:predicted HTH transcriptional regulator